MKGSGKAPGIKDHSEKQMGQLKGCDLKYGGQFDNPEKLLKNADNLASYVKKNKNV